jgi:hypothetical protein
MVVSIVMAIFFQSVAGSRWACSAPFLSKACCQHGVSSIRRVRLKATKTEHGGVNDQNKEAIRSTAGRTSPLAMPRAARQATLRPDASSLTASVVSD